jgi:hypothetical protein
MRYLAGLFILFLSVVGISNAAQHSHGGGNVPSHASAPSHPGHFSGDGGHYAHPEARAHFNGRRFDYAFDHAHFGTSHYFRVNRFVYGGGYPRFWYGGFWFNVVDPWPLDWCYCDDVYIDYDDASDCYFLYNRYHTSYRVRIGVVL